MASSLLTLDSVGIIEDPDQKIERILSYLITTEASQSNVHRQGLISIPDIIRRHGNNTIGIKNAVETALENALRGYFDNVLLDIEVRTDEISNEKLIVVIRAKVQQHNKWYDLARALSATHDSIEMVTDFNIT